MARVVQAADVRQRLLAWYAATARDLPWRHTRDPYAILVAEVMLQQTQVDRVIPKWQVWLNRFPTLQALASASRADAIRAWQGLGYNMRAVRLHAIAGQAMAEYQGELPREVGGLLTLKGVGRYTAGAVACFAYEQPVAMVDTNIRRVLSRVFGVAPGGVEQLADDVLPADAAYPWNQALMDLGATLCRAREPLCLACPLVDLCDGPGLLPPRAPSASGEAFRGSRRYYRGRLVDAVRGLPDGGSIGFAELVAQVAALPDYGRVQALAQQLVRDGLLSVDDDGRARLPI
ncbi:MAG TPA: A/G-specific adenine glycosylase [Chloroflexota bacterium]|nr:A/G-specific adenine glycosylase [Chloroflexota bacterium]